MIQTTNQPPSKTIAEIINSIVHQTERQFQDLDVKDDLKNLLLMDAGKISCSKGCLESENANGYMYRALNNSKTRFITRQLKQVTQCVTNMEVSELGLENGVFRNRKNRHGECGIASQIDIQKFISGLKAAEDRECCISIMNGETCRELAARIGVSHTTVGNRRNRVLKSARFALKEYANDRN